MNDLPKPLRIKHAVYLTNFETQVPLKSRSLDGSPVRLKLPEVEDK